MLKETEQVPVKHRKYRLTHLKSLNQVIKGLAKTIRAMSTGELDSQVGGRICSALGIMRQCLETAQLERIEQKLDLLGASAIYVTPTNQVQFYGSKIHDSQITRAN